MADTTTAPPPVDSISFDPTVTFADGTFTLTGHVSSTVGVKSVTLQALKNVIPTTLGNATVDASGNFSFVLQLGKDSFSSISATETDNAGKTKVAQSHFSLEGGAVNRPYRAIQESFTAQGERTVTNYFRTDGSIQSSMFYGPQSKILYTTTNNDDGSNTILVQTVGTTIPSNYFDTIENGGRSENTFVFNPGYELDIIQLFRVGGGDHDTLSLPAADFTSIADVLRHTRSGTAGTVIHDPVSHDAIRLPGLSKAELVHNRQDFTFHP